MKINKKIWIVLNMILFVAALFLGVYALYTKEYFSMFLFLCIVIGSGFRIGYHWKRK